MTIYALAIAWPITLVYRMTIKTRLRRGAIFSCFLHLSSASHDAYRSVYRQRAPIEELSTMMLPAHLPDARRMICY